MATLLITRPEALSSRLVDALAARGVQAPTVISPVIEIRPRDVTLPEGAELVLTSQNAVPVLPAGRWRAWCVGDRTAEAAAAAGLQAVSAGGDAEALLRLLLKARPGPLIHVRGAHAAGEIVERLREAGLAAEEVVAYDQVPLRLSAEAAALLAGRGAVVMPLYSPRSAGLVAAHPGPWRADVRAVAISPAAARAFGRPAHITIAGAPNGEAMEGAIVQALKEADGPRLVDRDGAG